MLTQSDEIRELIKSEMKKRNLSASQIARLANLTYEDIRQFLAGRVHKPNYFILQPLLAALNITEPPATAPFVGELSAGNFLCHDPFNDFDEHTVRIKVPYRSDDGVVFQITGDSMDKEIPDGYFVLVEPIKEDLRFLDKRIVLVQDEDSFLSCKQYDHTSQRAKPCSSNPEHIPIILRRDGAKIIGVVRNAFKNWGV
jgi:transcriptional regulator with XRE-family HTH domain